MVPALEIIASCVEDARAAQAGGADSLEICVALEQDGLTAPLAMIRAIRDAVQLPLNVLLRPHARDFLYTPAELDQMLAQVDDLKRIGVHTIVFGAHAADGSIDCAIVREFARAAAPTGLTLHRALDWSQQPENALQALQHDVARVLTSGGAPGAWQGRDTLRQWVARYGQHLHFAIAGGVNLQTIRPLAETIHAPEYHVGSGARRDGLVDRALVQQLKITLTN
jgi:copper homeostasis protein